MTDELKSCPFCGSSAGIDGDDYHGYNAECDDCGTRVTDANFGSEEKAAEVWNRRAALSSAQAPDDLSIAITNLADTFERFLGDIGHSQDSWQRDQIAKARAALKAHDV